MRIDLHTHSSVSDGTETPADLLAAAARRGPRRRRAHRPRHHRGWAAAAAARPPRADRRPRHGVVLPLVPGRLAADQRPPARLPLRPGPPRPARRARAAARRAAGPGRADRRRRWPTAGYPVTWERIVERLRGRGGRAGRTSPARWSTPASSTSVDQAFATLLHHRSPYYVAKVDTDVREGIALVRAAGRGAGVRARAGHASGGASSATPRSPPWSRPVCWAWRSTTPTTPRTSAPTCAASPPTST